MGDRLGIGGVECIEDRISVRPRPLGQYVDRIDQRRPERGELVLDAGRHLGIRVAADESVRLEPSKRLGKHLSGDAADQRDQLAMAHRALAEAVEHDHRPLVGDQLDRQTPRAVGKKGITGTEYIM